MARRYLEHHPCHLAQNLRLRDAEFHILITPQLVPYDIHFATFEMSLVRYAHLTATQDSGAGQNATRVLQGADK